MSVEIYEGSILDTDVDVIVNPANGALMHGGGLARIIDEAAHEAARDGASSFIIEDLMAVMNYNLHRAYAPTIPTGGAILGPSGALRQYKGIIHAVGPIWGQRSRTESRLALASAYGTSLQVAWAAGCKSIAFPAISAGIYGAPIAEVAMAAAHACQAYNNEMEIVFALVDDEHVATFKRFLDIP